MRGDQKGSISKEQRFLQLSRVPSGTAGCASINSLFTRISRAGGRAIGMRRHDSSPFEPLDGDRCAGVRQRRQNFSMVHIHRRHSTPAPTAVSGDDDSEGMVDLRKLAVLTAMYSFVEGCVTYPYELIKTRQQAAPVGSAAHRMSTLAYVEMMIEHGGPRSLYRGFSWNVVGGVPSEVAYFAMYTHAKELGLQTRVGQQHPGAVYFLAGLLSDTVSILVWVPFDIVAQRLSLKDSVDTRAGASVPAAADSSVSSVSSVSMSAPGRGAWSAEACGTQPIIRPWVHLRTLSSMGRAGTATNQTAAVLSVSSSCGAPTAPATTAPNTVPWQHLRALSSVECAPLGGAVLGSAAETSLAAGDAVLGCAAETTGLQIVASIVRREGVLGLWRGTWLTMASLAPGTAVWWLTHELAKKRIASDMGASEENGAVLAASGSLAAVISTTVSMPMDVIKTRLQCSEQPQTARQVLRGVLREAGWAGLWSGFLPRMVAAVPRSVLTVIVYERAVALCRL